MPEILVLLIVAVALSSKNAALVIGLSLTGFVLLIILASILSGSASYVLHLIYRNRVKPRWFNWLMGFTSIPLTVSSAPARQSENLAR